MISLHFIWSMMILRAQGFAAVNYSKNGALREMKSVYKKWLAILVFFHKYFFFLLAAPLILLNSQSDTPK